MNIDDLFTALKDNAEKAHKPIPVPIDGLGTIYIRRRTVVEFEELAAASKEDPEPVNGAGKFGPALARLLCDENGDRFPLEHRDKLAHLLAAQPEAVFYQLRDAADGTADVEKAAAPGN